LDADVRKAGDEAAQRREVLERRQFHGTSAPSCPSGEYPRLAAAITKSATIAVKTFLHDLVVWNSPKDCIDVPRDGFSSTISTSIIETDL
ncbi:MAG: hypothetical protein ACTSU5_10225, partial [Promethearchaeota archaeon]